MKMTRCTSQILAIAILSALLLIGCQAKPSALADDQVVQVTKNILAAINDENYQDFIQDFSEEMISAISEEQFAEIRDMLQSSSGDYISCEAPTLLNNSGFAIYRLICEFEQEDVAVTVTFKIDGDRVEGLFFDSPNLRELNP